MGMLVLVANIRMLRGISCSLQCWVLMANSELLINGVCIYAGYIGSASFLSTVLKVVDRLRSINPNLVYGKGFYF